MAKLPPDDVFPDVAEPDEPFAIVPTVVLAELAELPPQPVGPLARLSDVERDRVKAFLQRKYAPATRRAYDRAWNRLRGWLTQSGLRPVPVEPASLVLFLEYATRHLRDRRWGKHASRDTSAWSLAEVNHAISACARVHRLAGYDPPPTRHVLVLDAWAVLRQTAGVAPHDAKTAAVMEELQALVAQIDRNQLVGKRDAAVILVGWWTSMRRSELVALQFDDVKTVRGGGIALHTGRSKTDQEGEGMWRGFDRKGGELCPVEALDAWMSELTNAGHTTGPIFRGFTAQGVIRRTALHAQEVARIVKQLARAAGLDPKKYGGHSLRAGHITEAILQDVPTARIMAQTGHRSATTLQRYYRAADPVARGSASAIKVPSSETKR